MDLKYIQASFAGGKTVTTVPATKYDSGQFLKITGIELPSAFEVHFGNSGLAEYIVVAGTTSDGISVTQIPNILLKDSGPIIAYIYLTVSESTRTVYVINIPVIERAGYEPTSSDPNDPHYISGISELIEAANQDVETASEAAETSEAAKTEAIEAKEDSVFSREAAETAMEQAIAAKNEILASIDQTYSSISENAQSGVAVAQALNTTKPKLIIDYTTTEDVNTITFDNSILLDPNYNFDNYSHFIVVARMKFIGTATFEVKGKYAEIATSAILNYGSSVNGLNDCVYKGWYFEVMIKNRTPIFLGGGKPMINNSVDNGASMYMRCQPNNEDYNLQKYASLTILDRASSANTILAGTNFKIWGVNY